MTDFRKIYAVQKSNEERFLRVNKNIPHTSGIYILYRFDENGFKYAYVGQAKDLLKRLGQHLNGYDQHIDRSLRKHKLYNEENPYGWNVKVHEYPESELDEQERRYIKICAENGYQLRNVTLGGQNVGKTNITENMSAKTYRQGIKYGEQKNTKEVKNYFEKYLNASPKKDSKICNKKLQEFKEKFLGENNEKQQN